MAHLDITTVCTGWRNYTSQYISRQTWITFSFRCFLSDSSAMSQQVDELRILYNETSLVSCPIGFSAQWVEILMVFCWRAPGFLEYVLCWFFWGMSVLICEAFVGFGLQDLQSFSGKLMLYPLWKSQEFHSFECCWSAVWWFPTFTQVICLIWGFYGLYYTNYSVT